MRDKGHITYWEKLLIDAASVVDGVVGILTLEKYRPILTVKASRRATMRVIRNHPEWMTGNE